jgi:cytochrome c553
MERGQKMAYSNCSSSRAQLKLLRVALAIMVTTGGLHSAYADQTPSWAFLVADPSQPPENPAEVRRVPGSTKTYTLEQVNDLSNPPDWVPTEHPPAPTIVSRGSGPDVQACAACHLYSGLGHPESANLAGQPAAYLIQQMADFKSGARVDPARMTRIGKAISDDDARIAANWFASLKPKIWFRVIETTRVPRSRVTADHLRVKLPGTGTELLGERIIEMAEDADRAIDRDPRSGFMSYVPPGSIAKGRMLAKGGVEGRSIACTTCHGPDLEGVGEVPRIAGLSAVYVGRQLAGFRGSARTGAVAEPMRAAAANLTDADILALSAYLVSLKPR